MGCGLGGTAKHIQDQGFGEVTGFDVEKKSIQYAMEHYPDVEFHTADVVDAGAGVAKIEMPEYG